MRTCGGCKRTLDIAHFMDPDGRLEPLCNDCAGHGDNAQRAAADLLAYWPVWQRRYRPAESAA